MREIFDAALFFLLVYSLQVVTLHGPELSSYLYGNTWNGFSETGISVHLIPLFAVIVLCVFRYIDLSARTKGLSSFFVAVVAVTLSQIASEDKSINGLFVQLIVYGGAAFVIFSEPHLLLKYKSGFAEKALGAIISALKYLVVMYVAGIAALKYISPSLGESSEHFIAQFIYPTIALIGVMFMIARWVLLPLWEKIVEENRTLDAEDV